MIRFARNMAWLRWRLTVNALRPTGRRDRLERASRALEVIGPALLLALFLPALLLSGFLGLIGGWFLSQADHHRPILFLLRVVFGFEILLSLLAPLLRAAQGSLPGLTRFLLLPVSRSSLYATEAASTLVDPWLALFVCGALGLSAGILASAGPAPAAIALAVGAAGIGLLSGLSVLCATTAHLLFRDRRRGEMASVLLLGMIAVAGMLPALLSLRDPARRRGIDIEIRPAPAERKSENSSRREAPGGPEGPLTARTLIYPPELYARGIGLAATGRPAAGALPLIPLALLATAAHFVAMRLHRRLLETPEVQSSRRRGGAFGVEWRRFPGLSPAASAVAAAQVRVVHRSVQGKISLCVMPVVILALGTIWSRLPAEAMLRRFPLPLGVQLAAFGVLFSILSLESATLNQFAMDRTGLALTFLSPVSDSEILDGKAAGNALLLASRAIPCMVAAALTAPGGSLLLWLAVPPAGAAVYSFLAPGAAFLSALFPKAVDLGRMGQRSKPHPVASLLGMLFLAAGTAPAAGLALVGILLFGSPTVTLALVAGWAVAAVLLARPLRRSAARLLGRRRENLSLVAQGR
jgi:hypothetical protein